MSSFANKVAGGAVKQTKQTAQQIAKKIAQEQLEMLKSAKTQVGLPTSEQAPVNMEMPPAQVQNPNNGQPQESPEQMKARLDAESKRLLEKLESELAQLRQKRAQEDQARKQQEEQAALYKQQQEQQAAAAEPPTIMGKMRKKIGGMGAKLKQIAGKRETQKNASG